MTNNKDLKTIQQQFKEQLNTPKTEERIILEQEDLYPDLAVKKSKLSPVARNKIINRSGGNYVSENQTGYGPCPEGESTSSGGGQSQEAASIKITIEYNDDNGGLSCTIL
jgi:hypothetical protein